MQADTAIQLPKRKRNPDDGELDITPMIDVTFLLLAFFVVVSKMDPQANVPLPMATAGQSVSEKECITIIMTMDEGADKPNIFLGASMKPEDKVPDGDPEAQEEAIADFVESEFTEFPTKNAVVLKASGKCKTGQVEMVKRGIAASPLGKERKIYVGIEEEQ